MVPVLGCESEAGFLLQNFIQFILDSADEISMPSLLNSRVLCGSVIKCLTHNRGVLGSSHTGSSGISFGGSLGKTFQSPSLVLVKHRIDMNNVSCFRDMTEILLKAAYNN